jgi:hypothetical protein
MDGNVPRSTAIRFLEQFEREFGVYVGELRASLNVTASRNPFTLAFWLFNHGIEGMEAQLSWAQKARRQLEEDVR